MSKRIPQISIYQSKIQIEIKTLESSFLLESSLFDTVIILYFSDRLPFKTN